MNRRRNNFIESWDEETARWERIQSRPQRVTPSHLSDLLGAICVGLTLTALFLV